MASQDDAGELPAIEITVSSPGSCPVLSAGGRVLYRHPEILARGSDRVCGQALLTLVPTAESLALAATGGQASELSGVACGRPGCGAVFHMRALSAEEESSLRQVAATSAGKAETTGTRITRYLGREEEAAERPFLGRLEPALVREIVDLSLVSHYDSPAVVIREGQEGQALYIVGEGEVEVVRTSEDKDIVLATLRKGDCFGEISLLTGQPATATVRSKGSGTAVLVLPRQTLEELLLRRRALHREFSRLVAERLYRTHVAMETEAQHITGRLSMIGFVDLVQTLHASRRTGTLELNDDRGRAARLGFRDGDVVAAVLGDQMGTQAFHDVLTWRDGYFEFEGGEPSFDSSPGAQVTGGTMALLMEGLRRMDERGRTG